MLHIPNSSTNGVAAPTDNSDGSAFDVSKVNIDSGMNIVMKNSLSVSTVGGKIAFNLLTVIPQDGLIKDYNINLFDQDNKIINIGLGINTNKELVNIYPSMKLKGIIYYQKGDSTYEISFDSTLQPNTNNSAIVEVKNLTSVTLDTAEDVVNHMLERINSLQTQVDLLQIQLNAQ